MNPSRQTFSPSHRRASVITAAGTTSANLTHRYEQYLLLARQSAQAGDRIEAENLLQHAEHCYRTIALRKAGQQQ